MKAFWYKSNNFGDQLTPVVLEWVLNTPIELAHRNDKGKLLGIGSIITALRANDVVWGSGSIRQAQIPIPTGVEILALRGPLTAMQLNCKQPAVYGDPALLLPLIYKPDVEKSINIGFLPHYVDNLNVKFDKYILHTSRYSLIDIKQPWEKVIEEILMCDRIVTSSLHGIIACEAYGIPVTWERWSDKIIGGQFKFQDYFAGTDRGRQQYGKTIEPLKDLEKRQQNLINVLKNHYGKT